MEMAIASCQLFPSIETGEKIAISDVIHANTSGKSDPLASYSVPAGGHGKPGKWRQRADADSARRHYVQAFVKYFYSRPLIKYY